MNYYRPDLRLEVTEEIWAVDGQFIEYSSASNLIAGGDNSNIWSSVSPRTSTEAW